MTEHAFDDMDDENIESPGRLTRRRLIAAGGVAAAGSALARDSAAQAAAGSAGAGTAAGKAALAADAAAGAAVDPKTFGAAGDGITDDTDALRAAFGTGENIVMSPTDTYLISGALEMKDPAQILFANGATLKRCPQYSTTTDTSTSAGSTTQITVADASAIRVGHALVLEQGGVYDATSRRVTKVEGNTVTFADPVGVTLSGTSNVWLNFLMVVVHAPDVRVYHLRIDGQRSQWQFNRWEVTGEIFWIAGSHNLIVEGCHLWDCAGEGILGGDSDNVRVAYNTVVNANGNGIHFGGHPEISRTGGRVIGNHVKDVNLDPQVGHAEGCVILSSGVKDLLVAFNLLENGISGVGSINSSHNLDITIVGNEIRDCTSYAIEGNGHTITGVGSNVLIEGNRIYDSQKVFIHQWGGDGVPDRWTVKGNLLVNTFIEAGRARWLNIEGNTIQEPSAAGDLITVVDCQHVRVSGNVLTGGATGIRIDDPDTAHVSVTDNVLDGQSRFGIRGYVAGMRNVQILGNSVTNDTTATPGYEGIRLLGPNVVRGNSIDLVQGRRCISVVGGAQAVIKDNVARKGKAGSSIAVDNVASKTIVKDNETDAPVVDKATTSVVVGNLIL